MADGKELDQQTGKINIRINITKIKMLDSSECFPECGDCNLYILLMEMQNVITTLEYNLSVH